MTTTMSSANYLD